MTNKEAIEILRNYHNGYFGYKIDDVHKAHDLAIKALESSSWIPVKTKDLTDEDVVRLVEKSCGLFDADDFEHWKYDCKLPDRNQEVFITTKYGIASTTFCVSLEFGCYFEDYEERDDVLAWMPMPEPYKEEDT